MPVTVSVWWIGAKSLSIGHTSAQIGNTYVTWLGDGSGSSSAPSAESSSSGSSQSSSSSQRGNVDATLVGGTWTFANDDNLFRVRRRKTREQQAVPLIADGGPFGLYEGMRLTAWWTAVRGVVTPKYTPISTEHNCNVYTMKGLRMAGSSLYAKPDDFWFYAGSHKVITHARTAQLRIDYLNALWVRQAIQLIGPGDGAPIQTPVQWDMAPVRLQFPGTVVRTQLQRYANVNNHHRDRLDALARILEEVITRLTNGAVPIPAPVAVAVQNLAQIVPLPAPPPPAPVVNPLDAVRTFGKRVRDGMLTIEAAYQAVNAAHVLSNP